MIEPVQGEAGFLPVPPRFLQRIRELSEQHGIVMIADEVQCGSGRTGRMFAVEHYGIVPDMIASAKSLGAGMPIGAVTGRAEIMDSAHLGGVGSTYGGNPAGVRGGARSAEDDSTAGVPGACQPAGRGDARSAGRLDSTSWPVVGDVRGLGPMMLVELVTDRESKTPLPATDTLAVVRHAVSNGVLLIRAGLFSNCIRFLPPLNMPEDMLREALEVVGRAIETAVADRLLTRAAQ